MLLMNPLYADLVDRNFGVCVYHLNDCLLIIAVNRLLCIFPNPGCRRNAHDPRECHISRLVREIDRIVVPVHPNICV
jgi:hypothetical protein